MYATEDVSSMSSEAQTSDEQEIWKLEVGRVRRRGLCPLGNDLCRQRDIRSYVEDLESMREVRDVDLVRVSVKT